jgi:hypothetical protein
VALEFDILDRHEERSVWRSLLIQDRCSKRVRRIDGLLFSLLDLSSCREPFKRYFRISEGDSYQIQAVLHRAEIPF